MHSKTPPEDLTELITVNETFELTGIPARTLYRMWQRGDGPPSVTVGRARVFRRADVLKWIDERAGATR